MYKPLKCGFCFIIIAATAFAFQSCQRVIDVQTPASVAQLVIEANLTDQYGPQTVTLSTSVPYGNANVYPPVTGAQVQIDDATGNVYKLKETIPGTYTINYFKGTFLNLYQLSVVVNGQNYSATSVMPHKVNLDSLTLYGQLLGNKIVKTVGVNYIDPLGEPNQYRFIMYVNGVQVHRVFVENDTYNDGKPVTTLLYEDEIELKTKDIVTVEMQCIDPAVYNYWFSLSSQGGNTPADSATPSNPPSNFDNGALGYFSAHTFQRKVIIVP